MNTSEQQDKTQAKLETTAQTKTSAVTASHLTPTNKPISPDRRPRQDVSAVVTAVPPMLPVGLVSCRNLFGSVQSHEAASEHLSPAQAQCTPSLTKVVQDPQAVPEVLAADWAKASNH